MLARQVGSPLDSLVRLLDSSGKVVAWNDDNNARVKFLHVDRIGLMTHQADSYLMAKLPETCTHYVQISDARSHGSASHAYRLRITAPRPGFELHATPLSLGNPSSALHLARTTRCRPSCSATWCAAKRTNVQTLKRQTANGGRFANRLYERLRGTFTILRVA